MLYACDAREQRQKKVKGKSLFLLICEEGDGRESEGERGRSEGEKGMQGAREEGEKGYTCRQEMT